MIPFWVKPWKYHLNEDLMGSISDILKKLIVFKSLEEVYLKENSSKLPIFCGPEDNEMNMLVSSTRSQL